MPKKFNLDQFLKIANAVAPLALAGVPGGEKLEPLVPLITGSIAVAQAIPDATGPEKKALVQHLVRTGVTVANATGKIALDPVAIDQIADNGIDAVIGAINERKRLKAK